MRGRSVESEAAPTENVVFVEAVMLVMYTSNTLPKGGIMGFK